MNLIDFLFIYSPDPTASSKTNKKRGDKDDEEPGYFVCKICGFQFKFLSWLMRHLATHDPGTHRCIYCNKNFKKKENLKVHSLVHFGRKTFICKECNKSYKHKCNLTFHIKNIHQKLTKSFCNECKINFSSARTLKYHENRYHTGNMPFKCRFCSVTFHAPNDLCRHIQKMVIYNI